MLLMIDNYDSFTYNLVQYFYQLGQEVEVHRNDLISLETLFDKIFPNDRPAFTALQIPLPSPNVEASVSMTAIVSLS